MPSQPHSSAYFNPRSGERSDRNALSVFLFFNISIHAPANGATDIIIVFRVVIPDFNPRSGERNDDGAWPTRRAKIISIHAPANGATYYNSSALDGITISIHAPANGATVATTE